MMKTGSTWDQFLHTMDDKSKEVDYRIQSINDLVQTIQILLSAVENQVSTVMKRLDDVDLIQDDIKARILTLKDDVKDIAPRGEARSDGGAKDAAGGEPRSEDDDF